MRDWFSGRIPAFQAGDKSSILLSRTKKCVLVLHFILLNIHKFMTFEMPSTSEEGIGEVNNEFIVTDPTALEAVQAREETLSVKERIETQKMQLANLRRFVGDKDVSLEIQTKITSVIDESQPLFDDSESVGFRKILVGVIGNKINAIYRDLGMDPQEGNNTSN